MTDSLRRELVIFGIDAIAVGPGSVKTPIWDKAEEAVREVLAYESVIGSIGKQSAELSGAEHLTRLQRDQLAGR